MRVSWWQYLAMIAVFCCPAFGQWTPVSASQTTTVQVISADGKITSHREQHERYYRKASGSVLIQEIADDGSNLPVSAVLLDHGKTHRSYKLDYVLGTADDKHQPAQSAPPRTGAYLAAAEPGHQLPEATVNGIHCVVVPASLYNAKGGKEVVGRVWLAPEYNFLLIKEDTLHPLPGGGHLHVMREMQGIIGGVEPDDLLFATDAQSIQRARMIPERRQVRR
jgi:hypothetical protein